MSKKSLFGLLVVALTLIALISCAPNISNEPKVFKSNFILQEGNKNAQPKTVEMQDNPMVVETPDLSCASIPTGWRNIQPGKSSREDVSENLGKPDETGNSGRLSRDFFSYQPIISIPGSEESLGNTVYFDQFGVVEWVDVWEDGLVQGVPITVSTFVQRFGSTLDRIYLQEEADIFGPTQVYVWSECGLAIITVSPPSSSFMDRYIQNNSNRESVFKLRNPIVSGYFNQALPSLDDLVLRVFLFQPTNFSYFQENFENKIPYLLHYRLYLEILDDQR